MQCNQAINNFRNFVLSSWTALGQFTSELSDFEINEVVNDWLQFHWEILVERNICGPTEFLEFYGEGADCNGTSSRVSFSEKPPTHKIVCRSHTNTVYDLLSNTHIDLGEADFENFVSWNNNWYFQTPPFDHVLLNSGREIVVDQGSIFFDIKKL